MCFHIDQLLNMGISMRWTSDAGDLLHFAACVVFLNKIQVIVLPQHHKIPVSAHYILRVSTSAVLLLLAKP